MKILAVGDVVGESGVEFVSNNLPKIRKRLGIDFCVLNCENAANIKGCSLSDAQSLLSSGADVLTSGNHIFGKRDIYSFLDDSDKIIRPANFPAADPGKGYTLLDLNGYRVLCMNVMGNVGMSTHLSCPFAATEKILSAESGNYDLSILDIHAEATSEKIALAKYFDGKIDIIFGTHTHVLTADAAVLPGGSGYITDIGMTGPCGGVIGADLDGVLHSFLTQMPSFFGVAQGEVTLNGAIFDISVSLGEKNKVSEVKFLKTRPGSPDDYIIF